MFWFASAYAAEDVCSTWTASALVTEVDHMPSEQSSGLALAADGFLTLDDAGGEAALYRFDLAGNFLGSLVVEGATNTDWEDLAVAPCSEGECAFVADIGDNEEVREGVVVWRVPLTASDAVSATACALEYDDDEPHDAEALLVFPDGSVRIATKSSGTTRIFHSPPLECGGAAQVLTEEASLELSEPVTGGAASADGSLVVLRGNTVGWAWRGCTLDWSSPPTDLLFVGEEQGEGVTIAEDGTLYSSSEGKTFELHELPCTAADALVCDDCGCTSGPRAVGLGIVVAGGAMAWGRRRRPDQPAPTRTSATPATPASRHPANVTTELASATLQLPASKSRSVS